MDDLVAVSTELTAYFADPSQVPDPYPMLRRLRQLEPVHWSAWGTWVVTGYPEAEQILKSPAFGREGSAVAQFRGLGVPGVDPPDVVEAVDIWLAAVVNRDQPDHTRLRRLVSRPFGPRALASWRPRIEQIVHQLIDAVQHRDEFDFLHEVAYPLPSRVICEIMDVPFADLERVQPTLGHTRIMTPRGDSDVAPPAEDLRAATQRQMAAQVAYFREVVADRRRKPGDDLISALVQAEDEGHRLSMDELIGTVMLIVGAGHETTANLLGNGMLALLRHPEQMDLLRRQPDLVPNALEEVLRHESPSRGQPRIATETVTVGGKLIEEGQQVAVILNACNRDPRVYAEPDRFDVTRRFEQPHITFTVGIHHCLGAALARAEAGAMLGAIVDRLGDLQLATDEVRWRPAFIRGLEALPVRRR